MKWKMKVWSEIVGCPEETKEVFRIEISMAPPKIIHATVDAADINYNKEVAEKIGQAISEIAREAQN